MGFDEAAGNVVLFGGVGYGGTYDDTWIWDGANWILQHPTHRPAHRRHARLIPAAGRASMLLVGGQCASGDYIPGSDLWEWTGSDWNPVSVAGAVFPSRVDCAATGPGRAEVIALEHPRLPQSTRMWSWDGSSWTETRPTSTGYADWPANFADAELVYDRAHGRLLRFGCAYVNVGTSLDPYPKQSTWAFDFASRSWSIADSNDWLPAGEFSVVHDADRGRDLFVGGVPTRTWFFQHGRFHESLAATPQRVGVAFMLECHYASGQVVLFGDPGVNRQSETWLFDGQQWRARQYPGSPDPFASQLGMASTYDPVRQRVLAASVNQRELWAFTPAGGWQNLGSVPVRPGHLAYDVARNVLVLLGPSGSSQETWEWDGQAWALRSTVVPMLSSCYVMSYVPGLDGVVLVMGGACRPGVPVPGRTFVWDGTQWSPLLNRAPPEHDVGQRSFRYGWYDPERGRFRIAYEGNADLATFELYDKTLAVDELLPRAGESLRFTFDGPSQAGRQWFLGLALTADIGVPLMRSPYGGMRRFPLDPDVLLIATLGHLQGTLDPQGRGSKSVVVPADPSLVGLRFKAAAFTLDSGAFGFVSNLVECEVVP